MTLWVHNDDCSALIEDTAPWTGPDGTSYPNTVPKFTIPGMAQVNILPRPDNATGYSVALVNGVPTWTWTTTPLAAIELAQATDLPTAKAAALAYVGVLADSALNAPITLSSLGFSTSFAPQWSGLITGAKDAVVANPALIVQWEALDGSFHALNASQVTAAWTAAVGYIQAVYAKQAALIATINSEADTSGLKSVAFTVGWPATTI